MHMEDSMQKDAESRTPSGETSAKPSIEKRITAGLLEEMTCLLAAHGVGAEALAAALDEVFSEKNCTFEKTAEDLRASVAGLVLWKLYARDSSLWIHARTRSGNEIPVDLLVAGYTMWTSAGNLASKHGVEGPAAAEAFAQAVHATADRLARNRQDPEIKQIGDVRKYIFASYMYSIFRIAREQGIQQTEYVDMQDWIENRELSDQGAFLGALESRILFREVFEAMPPKGRSVALARYVLGYSWPETAGAMGTSVNAAQKALSSGIRKAVGACMGEIRKMGSRKAAHLESYMANTKKRSSGGE
jgi:DNA-directed RNA polymerase specialized sigma24 family protein